jgi:hypothetical protein
VPDLDPGDLDGDTIRRYLFEVADLLEEGPPRVLVVVGGSLLALHGLRASTRDVDSIRALDDSLRRAAATVAVRHGLEESWLNDRAAMFWPVGLTEQMCAPLLEHERLLVLEPPFRFVFVMKLEANRRADWPDLRQLWPACGFESAEQAAELWRAAYPYKDPDPYLADYIRSLTQQ